jgi:hypothetical protein
LAALRRLPVPPELATTMDSEIGLHLKPQTVKAIAPLVIHLQFHPSIFGRIPPSRKSPDRASI